MQTNGDTLPSAGLCWFYQLRTYFLWLHTAQWLPWFFIPASHKTLFVITHFCHNAQIGNRSSEVLPQSPPLPAQSLKRPFEHAILIICCAIISGNCNIFWQITGLPEKLPACEPTAPIHYQAATNAASHLLAPSACKERLNSVVRNGRK